MSNDVQALQGTPFKVPYFCDFLVGQGVPWPNQVELFSDRQWRVKVGGTVYEFGERDHSPEFSAGELSQGYNFAAMGLTIRIFPMGTPLLSEQAARALEQAEMIRSTSIACIEFANNPHTTVPLHQVPTGPGPVLVKGDQVLWNHSREGWPLMTGDVPLVIKEGAKMRVLIKTQDLKLKTVAALKVHASFQGIMYRAN